MATFPNPFFRKFTYPKNSFLRISSLNKIFPHKNHVLFNYDEEYAKENNEDFKNKQEKIPH